jgi:hypothetical protein
MTKQTKLIVLLFCIIKLTLHLIADSNSGFQGDELLHIETGKHLAWGFMEFPPLIGLIAFIQNLFHSNSVFVHHIFPHIASIVVLIFLAKTTIELGGKNRAIFLVLLAYIIAPSFGRTQQLFQPVVFSQLFWLLSFYALVSFVKNLDKKSLRLLTFFCVLGFYSKYDAIFFIFGLTSLLFFQQTRKALIQNKFWLNVLIFTFCILPIIFWQISNDYPVLQMFARLYEKQLDNISRVSTISKLLISINPVVSLFLFFTGIYYLASSKNKTPHNILGVSIALSFSFLLFKNGKSYYFFPIVLTVLPFGALFIEQKALTIKKWFIYPISVIMLLGSVLIPFGMPVYSFNTYLKEIYPFEKKEIEGGKYAVKYDEYYTKQKWQTTMQELKFVYDSLPEIEKKTCLIWGKHYGQAGAINLLGTDYNLPKSFSYHGSFYSWTPKGQMPETIIALSYRVGDFFKPYFEEVKLVRTIYNPYADNEEELYQRIYICKRPNQDFDKMKKLFKHRIFE